MQLFNKNKDRNNIFKKSQFQYYNLYNLFLKKIIKIRDYFEIKDYKIRRIRDYSKSPRLEIIRLYKLITFRIIT